jgi:integrase
VRALLDAARDQDPDLYTFLWLAATTGARRGELGALRWSDVDAERGELLVERSLVGIGRDTRVEDVSPEEMGKRVEKFMQDGGAG